MSLMLSTLFNDAHPFKDCPPEVTNKIVSYYTENDIRDLRHLPGLSRSFCRYMGSVTLNDLDSWKSLKATYMYHQFDPQAGTVICNYIPNDPTLAAVSGLDSQWLGLAVNTVITLQAIKTLLRKSQLRTISSSQRLLPNCVAALTCVVLPRCLKVEWVPSKLSKKSSVFVGTLINSCLGAWAASATQDSYVEAIQTFGPIIIDQSRWISPHTVGGTYPVEMLGARHTMHWTEAQLRSQVQLDLGQASTMAVPGDSIILH